MNDKIELIYRRSQSLDKVFNVKTDRVLFDSGHLAPFILKVLPFIHLEHASKNKHSSTSFAKHKRELHACCHDDVHDC